MELSATTVLATAAAVLAAVYLYFSYRYSYWKRQGVPHPRPTPIFGNFGSMILGRKSFSKGIRDMTAPYRELGYCGAYQWAKPILLVWQPEMVKQIVTKDFSSFHDRGIPVNENDPLSAHLFNLSGPQWRNLRNRLSPTFTSGKLKLMLPLMRDVGGELVAAVAADAKHAQDREVDVSLLLSRFATDVIATCAFGIQTNCLRDADNEFLAMSQKLFRQTPAQQVRFLLEAIHPKLGAILPIKWIFPAVHNFFVNLMKDTVQYREEHKVERNDFVQLMMQLRDADLGNVDPENNIAFTPGIMAAQAFIFFIAGLDNISNTVAFCLSRLALDPDLQDTVADEVRSVLRQHDGELSYEALKKMELVDRVASEGLRLWGPVGLLIRKCNATTQVGDVLIEKDMPVFLVTDRMHTDGNVFPEPKRFDPDRHTAEARQQRHQYSYLPFGEGPRNCIAERFARLEMKLALAVLLRDFTFAPGPRFEEEPELDSKAFFPRPKNGFMMRVEVRA